VKKAIVLSGGGSKGAFQVGVLKTLLTQGFVPDVIYGTSVGALNAGALSYTTIDTILEEWRSIKSRSDVLSFNLKTLTLFSDGIYHSTPLRKSFIDRLIVGTPRYESKVCRVNMNTGATEYVSNKEVSLQSFRDAVQDSATIPVAMVPRDIYVDGGVREVVPLARAVEEGCSEIKVILCNPWALDPLEPWDYHSKPKFLRFLSIALRTVDEIMNTEVKWNDLYAVLPAIKQLGINVEVYRPLNYLYDTLEFDKKKIAEAIILGQDSSPVSIFDLF